MTVDVSPPDVVYVVRPGDDNEELRYSLRSLRNLPHGEVWIAGHCPPWLTNVHRIPVPPAESKYASSTANLRAAADHDGVAERFVYCNDDFFIVEPLAEVPALHRGPVGDVLAHYRTKYPDGMDYVDGMAATARLLDDHFEITDPMSYELHVPMVLERSKVRVALDTAAEWGVRALHKRTLYGNLWRVGGSQVEDCKVHDYRSPWPAGPFVSTCDSSFAGAHGRTIRRLFPDPSPYERAGTAPQEDLTMGVLLRHRNGTLLTVPDEKAERLLRNRDFTVASQQPEQTTDYGVMTVSELKDEIARRNEGRDEPIPATGKKADLVAALEADDK